jgi:hypothetical protein
MGQRSFCFYILINAKTFQGNFGRWWLSMDEGEISGDIEDIIKEIHLYRTQKVFYSLLFKLSAEASES